MEDQGLLKMSLADVWIHSRWSRRGGKEGGHCNM